MIDPPPHYTTLPRVTHLITAAYGTGTNPRNIENPNYAPYKDSLSDLVNFPVPDGSLSAQQQYNFWLTKETVDQQGLSKDEADAAYTDGYSDAEQTPPAEPREPRRSKRLILLGAKPKPDTPGQSKGKVTTPGQLKGKANTLGQLKGKVKVQTRRKKADPESAAVKKALEAYDAFKNAPAALPQNAPAADPPAHGDAQPAADPPVHGDAQPAADPPAHGDGQPAQGINEGSEQPDGDYSQDFHLDETEEDDYEAANVSLTSVATVANSGGKDNFPDVVVSHTCVREMAEPKSPEARFAWEARLGQKVTHQCFPIIVELKRAPSRPLRDGKFTGEIARLLGAAETQLCYYIAVQLERDPYAPSVIAISGSGGWWRWAEFKREETAPLEFWGAQEDNRLPSEEAFDLFTAMGKKFVAQPIRHLGTEDSDNELNAIRQNALIPILEAHATCYKTAAVPRARTPPNQAPQTAPNSSVNHVASEFVVGSSRAAQAPHTAQTSPSNRAASEFVVGSSTSVVQRVTRRRGKET